MTEIVLCADDFSFSPSISCKIAELVDGRRVSAVSVMVNSPFFSETLSLLHGMEKRADVGLHFDLTEFSDGRSEVLSFSKLHRKCLSGAIEGRKIEQNFNRQISIFEDALGYSPHFIDGHQHVHHLPVIRKVVCEVMTQRFAKKNTYLRCCYESFRNIFSRGVSVGRALAFSLYGKRLSALALRYGIPFNHGFSGVYDFTNRVPYEDLFRKFLKNATSGTLILCHPGAGVTEGWADLIASQREVEYKFFSSDAFVSTLRDAGVVLSRFDRSANTNVLMTTKLKQKQTMSEIHFAE